MKPSAAAVDLIKRFESLSLSAYPDPATRGVPWTVGWGHTGPDVTRHTVWDQAEADVALERDIEESAKELYGLELTQNEFDALTSFVFNVGGDAFAKSTLRRKLLAGDHAGAADEFLRWNYAAGRVMRGLTRRRQAERALFSGTLPL